MFLSTRDCFSYGSNPECFGKALNIQIESKKPIRNSLRYFVSLTSPDVKSRGPDPARASGIKNL